MNEDIQRDRKENPYIPSLDEEFRKWTLIDAGKIHEREKILLISIFHTIIACLEFYTDDLEKHREWDDLLLKDVVDNLDNIKKKATMVLSRERDVKEWGATWYTFFKETMVLFEDDIEDGDKKGDGQVGGFRKVHYMASAILFFFETNNLKEKAKLEKVDVLVLKNLLEIFKLFENLSKHYGDFLRALKGKMILIEKELDKNSNPQN